MRLVVTGHSGLVASALMDRAALTDISVVPVGRPEFDLEVAGSIAPALVAARPDVIVSAAAYTAADKAEDDPQVAHSMNAIAPGLIAAAAQSIGVPIIHLSTDYVFDGSKASPYVETDEARPINIYGVTKRAGEVAVLNTARDAVVLRTAWIFGEHRHNFLKTMMRLAADRDEIGVVGDQFGNPTSADDLADGILAIARNLVADPVDPTKRGIFHMAGAGDTSWDDFARAILSFSQSEGGPHARIRTISTADFGARAARPANSRLCCDLLERAHGVRLPCWKEAMRQTVSKLIGKTLPSAL